MGAIISRLQSNHSDYERILSDLDSNIRKAELRLSAIAVREKRLMGYWLTYSVLAWLVYITVFVLHLHPQYSVTERQKWAWALAPVLLGLPVIILGRSFISVWYKRAKTNEESQLNMLRADQRLKVEELKKKTAYYSTKTLLERYDPSSQQLGRPGGARPLGPDGKPTSPQNGQPRQQPPNMMDPGLRQRAGLGVTNAQGVPVPGHAAGTNTGMHPHPQSHPQQHQQPRGPQALYGPGYPGPQGPGGPYSPPQNTERHWYDKIVDVIVGDEGPDTKYALICGRCFAHNGLVLPQEIDEIQYVCPKCNHFNPSKKDARKNGNNGQGSNGVQLPYISTPDMTLLQAQEMPLPPSRDPSPSPSAQRMPRPQTTDRRMHLDPQSFGTEHDEVIQDGDSVNHSEIDDVEFVNNWNDDEINHDEGDDDDMHGTDSDNIQGYAVDSEGAVSSSLQVPSPRTTRRSAANPTRLSDLSAADTDDAGSESGSKKSKKSSTKRKTKRS